MCRSRCIVSFRDTKTTTGTTTKLFTRPDNLRVLVLGFIDLLLLQPAQKFITPHQQSVSNVERRKSRILRKRQNSDDANDAESGIWYRDVLKTASRASSASLSSRKSSTGVWGYAPEMCMWMTTCYASKTRLPPKRRQSNPTRIQIRIFPRVKRPLIFFAHKSGNSLKSSQ